MSFKSKLRLKQQRKSDERRKKRNKRKKRREKEIKANKEKNLEISKIGTLKPELPENIVVEEVVKQGAMKGVISVRFDKQIYSINVTSISLKKMTYFVDTGKERCAGLEGYGKVIRLNKERATSTLASII
ncbi:MAG: hypothetical protein U9P70_04850 [Patescibacteria group bacterium]|nr:hypothetical protein [Patescibacteria group bacterium]